MKKVLLAVCMVLAFQPVLQALDTPTIVEDFDDLADAGMGARALEMAKTGGEYAIAFAVGFVGYLLLCATSVTVRKKSADFFERVRRAVAQLCVRDSVEKDEDKAQSDC